MSRVYNIKFNIFNAFNFLCLLVINGINHDDGFDNELLTQLLTVLLMVSKETFD